MRETIQNHIKRLHDQMIKDLESALFKDVHELTEQEKFSICLASGVDIDSECSENGFYWKVRYPCSIFKNNGKFIVNVKE